MELRVRRAIEAMWLAASAITGMIQ